MLGLDLCGVHFDADGPGEGVDYREEVDGEDDEPGGGGVWGYGGGGVEGADEEHAEAEAETAVDLRDLTLAWPRAKRVKSR